MENEGKEILTAKGGESAAPEAPTPKKRNRILIGALVAVGLCLALCIGAVAGGSVAYGLARARNRLAVRPSIGLALPHEERMPCEPGPDLDRGLGPDLDRVPERGFGSLGVGGALVVEVVEGGPADRAEITEGTVILSVDGRPLGPGDSLGEMIAEHKPGDEVTLEVMQLGSEFGGRGRDQFHLETREITVELGKHPDDKSRAYLGLSYMPFPGAGLDGSGMHPFMFEFLDDLEGQFEFQHKQDEDDRQHQFEFQWPPRGRGGRNQTPDSDVM
jgi:hypothetical protein